MHSLNRVSQLLRSKISRRMSGPHFRVRSRIAGNIGCSCDRMCHRGVPTPIRTSRHVREQPVPGHRGDARGCHEMCIVTTKPRVYAVRHKKQICGYPLALEWADLRKAPSILNLRRCRGRKRSSENFLQTRNSHPSHFPRCPDDKCEPMKSRTTGSRKVSSKTVGADADSSG